MTELGDLLRDMAHLSAENTHNIKFLFKVVEALTKENDELRTKLWNLERRINKVEIR